MHNLARMLIFGPTPDTDMQEQLQTARQRLDAESDKLKSDVQVVGRRVDPIGVIVRNIKRVQGG